MNHYFWLPAMLTALATASPAAAKVPANKEVAAALDRIYGHYRRPDNATADWEQPVFTAALRGKIQAWRRDAGDEPTDLSDFGWFCDCQDWDAKTFRAEKRAVRELGRNRIEVQVHVTVGWGGATDQRLILVREGGKWLVDDLFPRSTPEGIRRGLQRETAARPQS